MMYWINLALTRMGFWITWALVPIVVEIIPAIMSTIKLMRLHRHMPRLKAPAKWPWVTIIVPVYNSEDTLFDCIRSIDHQTYDKKACKLFWRIIRVPMIVLGRMLAPKMRFLIYFYGMSILTRESSRA